MPLEDQDSGPARSRWTMGIFDTTLMLMQSVGRLGQAGYLDKEYLERMGKKFDETRRSYTKALSFVLTAWVLLALSTATVPFSVSFLGFTITDVDLHRVREIVLVVAASMSFYYVIRVLQMAQIKLIVQFSTMFLYGPDKATTELIVQSYLTLDENWLAFGMTRTKPFTRRSLRRWVIISLGLSLLAFLLALFVAWEAMQFYVIYDVLARPQKFGLLSYAAGFYAIVMNIFILGLFGYYFIPFKRQITQPS